MKNRFWGPQKLLKEGVENHVGFARMVRADVTQMVRADVTQMVRADVTQMVRADVTQMVRADVTQMGYPDVTQMVANACLKGAFLRKAVLAKDR